jgi:hypothetical protein
VPIERKESIRWLENMRQATALLGDPTRLVHIGDRENDIYPVFPRCRGFPLTLCADSVIRIRDIAVVGWDGHGGRDG